jgi:hypothetical protein
MNLTYRRIIIEDSIYDLPDPGLSAAAALRALPPDSPETAWDRMAGAEADLRVSESISRPELPTGEAVREAGAVLFRALGDWRLIESRDLHWETAYPHLLAEAGECAGWELAMQQAFEEAEAAWAELGLAMTRHARGGNATTSITEEAS